MAENNIGPTQTNLDGQGQFLTFYPIHVFAFMLNSAIQ